jgi:hypothetical protein
MKTHILAAAALLAACGIPGAMAAPAPAEPGKMVYAPSVTGGKHALPFVDEPAASLAAHAADNGVAGAIVEAINADPSMKYSKVSVLPEEGGVTLVGVTVSDAQRKRALELAIQHAGEGKVANAIQSEELIVMPADTTAARTAAPAGDGTAPASQG